MPRTRIPTRIRAPSKISVGLKHTPSCIICGKALPEGRFMCQKCSPKFTKINRILRRRR